MDASWLSALSGPDYIWNDKAPGATDEEIAELARYFGRPLPEDYAAFLRLSNGADLWYGNVWNIQIWEPSEIPTLARGYGFTPDRMPGAINFGSDGGGEGLVFDIRPHHPDGQYPIIAVNFVTVGWKEIIPVAPDFKSLMLLKRELLYRAGSSD